MVGFFPCQRISKKTGTPPPPSFHYRGMESTWGFPPGWNSPGIQESTPESLTWIWLPWLPRSWFDPDLYGSESEAEVVEDGCVLLTSTYYSKRSFFSLKTWGKLGMIISQKDTFFWGDPMIFRVPCFFVFADFQFWVENLSFLHSCFLASGAQAERTQCTTRLWSFEGPTPGEVKKHPTPGVNNSGGGGVGW